GDIETVLSLMTEDVVFLIPGHAPMIGRSAFAAAAQSGADQPAPQLEGTSEIQEIQVHGELAFMWTKLTVVLIPPDGGQRMTRAGHTLSVLKKQNGQWFLARDANLLTPVPTA